MQKYQQVHESRKAIMVNNFLGGLAWAVGTTVGLTIFAALLSFLFSQVNLIPVIGEFVSDINNYVQVEEK